MLCEWHKNYIIGHDASTYRSDCKVIVTGSDKRVSCGWSIQGGRGGAMTLCPIYSRMQSIEEGGIDVVRLLIFSEILL